MKIVDPQGTWYLNTGAFNFHDPESKTVFEAGVLTKAKKTEWVQGQPVILEQPDPTAPAAPTVSEPKKAKDK